MKSQVGSPKSQVAGQELDGNQLSGNGRVLIIPCSGIGKAFGSVGREAAYVVIEELRPEVTGTVCLSLLTMGDEDAQRQVRQHPTITIDGCPTACAKVNVEQAGGTPAAIFRVFDVFKKHKELRVRQVSDIGENGRKMAEILAEEIAAKVDQLTVESPKSKVPSRKSQVPSRKSQVRSQKSQVRRGE